MSNLTIDAYQFIISSQYFSRSAVDLSNLKDSLLFSFFDKQIEDKVLFSSLRKGKDFLYSISAEKKKSLCGDFEAIENEVSSVFGNGKLIIYVNFLIYLCIISTLLCMICNMY